MAGPEVTVFIWLDVAGGDDAPGRADGTDFGGVGLGRPGVHRVVTVRNDGGAELTLGPIELPAGYTLLEDLDSAVPPGGHDTFSVRLNTAVTGTFSGSIRFSTNDPDEDPFTFAVTGRVNPPGAGATLAVPMGAVCAAENDAPFVLDLRDHFDDIGVDGTLVRLDGNLGIIDVELSDNVTPETVRNFLQYVDDGDYTDTFVHRAVTAPKYPSDVMIQAGGFIWPDNGYRSVSVDDPIVNEFDNWFDPDYGGLAPGTPVNVRWTVAMDKTDGDPDSATSRFFVNLADNSGDLDSRNGGFTVFGSVVHGQPVVEAIADLPVYDASGGNPDSPFGDLPLYNYTSGTIVRDNLAVFDSVTVIDELTFGITANTNPGLVTPAIGAGGTLTLTFAQDQTGVADMTVQATDWSGGAVEGTIRVVVAATPPARGDVNGDGAVGLDDAVLSLWVLIQSAEVPPGSVAVLPCIDVNADGKLGPEEAAFILQKIALVR